MTDEVTLGADDIAAAQRYDARPAEHGTAPSETERRSVLSPG